MPKRAPLHDYVSVDAVDLSRFARTVRFNSEHEQLDVSGFTDSGANEYLAGPTTQSLTVEFFGSYGTGEVHQTLYPIHRDREIVPIAWRPDMRSPIGVDNPELQGNVQLLSYSPGGSRGEVDTFEATFITADEDGLTFATAVTP
jgi:hypothetical protein